VDDNIVQPKLATGKFKQSWFLWLRWAHTNLYKQGRPYLFFANKSSNPMSNGTSDFAQPNEGLPQHALCLACLQCCQNLTVVAFSDLFLFFKFCQFASAMSDFDSFWFFRFVRFSNFVSFCGMLHMHYILPGACHALILGSILYCLSGLLLCYGCCFGFGVHHAVDGCGCFLESPDASRPGEGKRVC
jgi:hypothetical protein